MLVGRAYNYLGEHSTWEVSGKGSKSTLSTHKMESRNRHSRGPPHSPQLSVTKSAITILSCMSPQNHFSKNFKFIPHKVKNQNHLKKSLHVWVIEQFLFANF